MGKSQETSGKKDREKKKQGKRKDKEQKKEDRKANKTKDKSFEDMLAYVDEFGNITSTKPDPLKKKTVILAENIQIGVAKQDNKKPVDLIRNGRVTFFNDSKGYGFIKDLDTQESFFVHANGLLNPIKENDKVTFKVEMGHKGPNAVNVKTK
ncbi:MAG: cold shock domain-containing protein [Fimbriimonadaceae bacterium]|nr:cold shock domain-containing protein [Chitinophagales bacterium]